MSWFANVGERKRYDLPPELGGWIELRKELSVGERRRAFADAVKGQTDLGDGKTRTDYDHAKLSFGLVVAYLADWSEKAPVTPSAIEALTAEVYEAIEDIVDRHAEEFGARPPKRGMKGTRATKTSDARTSPSAA